MYLLLLGIVIERGALNKKVAMVILHFCRVLALFEMTASDGDVERMRLKTTWA